MYVFRVTKASRGVRRVRGAARSPCYGHAAATGSPANLCVRGGGGDGNRGRGCGGAGDAPRPRRGTLAPGERRTLADA
jgi:hypothetical protein